MSCRHRLLAEAWNSPRGRSRCHLHQDRGRFPNDDGGDGRRLHRREFGTAARGHAHRCRLSHEPRYASRVCSSDVQVARGMLATGNPEQLRGQAWTRCPGCKSRLAPLRVSELRDTAKPRARSGRKMPPCGPNLGIGSDPAHRLFHRGPGRGCAGHRRRAPARELGSAAAPLMKLVGSSLATGLERIEIQGHLRDLEERNELALYSANDGCGISTPSTIACICRRAGRRCWGTTKRTWDRRRIGARSCTRTTCRACRPPSAITWRARRRSSRACTACVMPRASGAG
jgi:hypothetical protein